MQNILNRVIRISLYSLVFLMPLFWLPFSFEAFEFNKLYLLFFLSAIAFFAWLVKMIVIESEIKFKRTPLDIFIAGFLLLAILSAIFSVDKLSSLFGFYGRFSDGLIALVSLVAVYFLITNNTSGQTSENQDQKPLTVKGLLKVFSWSFSLVLLLSYFSVFGIWQKINSLIDAAPAITLQRFFNPVAGSLEGLAIFLAVIAVFLVGLILIRDKNDLRGKNIFHWLILAASLALSVAINFRSAWLVLAVSLIIFLGFALSKRLFKKSVNRLLLPILLVIFALFFSLGTFKPFLSLAKEQVLDQKTSWQASFGGATEDLKSGFLGTGIGTWHYDFTRHKPASFNQNPLWQFRFDRSGSHFSEILGTMGFLGLLSWLGLLGLFFLTGWLIISGKSGKEFSETRFNLPFLMVVASLLVSQLFYYQNLVLAFVFWLFLALAAVVWQSPAQEKVFSLKKFPELNLVFSTFLIAGGLGLAALFFFGARFYLADNLFLKVQRENSLDSQIVLLEKMVRLNPYQPQYWSLLSRAYLQKTREESVKSAGFQDQEKIISLVNAARSSADQALKKGPGQVAAAETLAMVYRELRGFPEGQDRAVKSFEKAMALEPNNPILKIELARLLTATDIERAKREVELAKKLKSEYLDAMLLETAILEQEGNLEGALRAMEKAVSSYPFNLEARFQLGLLYFNSKKYDDAIGQLDSVLILAPNHSNALYSLGLTYQKKGSLNKAKDYFEKVLELNPDSQEVKEKLKELE